MTIQIVVITCSDKRRAAMAAQLQGAPWDCYLMPAHVPATSAAYLDVEEEADLRAPPRERHMPKHRRRVHPPMACALRSHAAALAWFAAQAEASDDDVLVVLEDDLLLHADFAARLDAVLAAWRTHAAAVEMLSLATLASGLRAAAAPACARVALPDGRHTISWSMPAPVWGAQAYAVTRATARTLVALLHKPTLSAVVAAVDPHNGAPPLVTRNRPLHLQPSCLLSGFVRQGVVLPPLAVESGDPSTTSGGIVRTESWRQSDKTLYHLDEYALTLASGAAAHAC